MSTEAAGRGGGWPQGYGRLILETCDSTMAEARRRAATEPGPLWIMARHQSAAHGRRGRPWIMPEGNFAATLLLPQAGAPDRAALRSFAAALAVHEALSSRAPAERLALKWPNDVLLDGGKITGILLEAGAGGSLAIGIGVNLVAAPEAGEVEPGAVPPVSLAGQGLEAPAPEDFLTLLAGSFSRLEASFATYGFAPIRNLWLARAVRLGEVITARLPGREITGIFETIDADGHLILRIAAGHEKIAAADVHF